MHIIKVGLDYQNAPLEIREILTFSESDVVEAMQNLKTKDLILENVIVSTCNRTEIFAVVEDIHSGIDSVHDFLMNWFKVTEDQFVPYVQSLVDDEAVDHLFKLVIGLDSMVIGETQILGQVRDAFLTAQSNGTTGTLFNELFKRAITFAKQAHRNTAISEQAVSISYVAVELAKKIFTNIQDKHVVILGAGEMGELALKNLQGAGVRQITVVNRTLERARKVAEPFNASAVHMGQLLHVLREADILISSTGSDEPVLTKESLQPLQKERRGNPLFLIDIAVPRDIDHSVKELDHVYLYDIDDLQNVVDKNLETRHKAAAVIETQIGYELSAFSNWVAMRDAVPAIRALREKSLTIQEGILHSLYRKMPDLTEREIKLLEKHTKSIIHQLLEEPIKHAKKIGENNEGREKMLIFKDIFGLHIKDESTRLDQAECPPQN